MSIKLFFSKQTNQVDPSCDKVILQETEVEGLAKTTIMGPLPTLLDKSDVGMEGGPLLQR